MMELCVAFQKRNERIFGKRTHLASEEPPTVAGARLSKSREEPLAVGYTPSHKIQELPKVACRSSSHRIQVKQTVSCARPSKRREEPPKAANTSSQNIQERPKFSRAHATEKQRENRPFFMNPKKSTSHLPAINERQIVEPRSESVHDGFPPRMKRVVPCHRTTQRQIPQATHPQDQRQTTQQGRRTSKRC